MSGRVTPQAAATAWASSSTEVARPVQTLAMGAAALAAGSAARSAATTSATYTKSRVCPPSPNTVTESPRTRRSTKMEITPE